MRQNRPALLHALDVVKYGLVSNCSSSSNPSVAVLQNLVLNLFPILMEIYLTMSHDEPQIARYSGDLNNGLIRYSNGKSVSDPDLGK